jgi:hypothetical protein
MRKRSMALIIVIAALLSQNIHAQTIIDDPFEFYSSSINPDIINNFSMLKDAAADDSLPDYVTDETAYYSISGIIPNSPFENRFRMEGISGIYKFITDFASVSELEPSTLLLVGIGILGLLTYRRKRYR